MSSRAGTSLLGCSLHEAKRLMGQRTIQPHTVTYERLPSLAARQAGEFEVHPWLRNAHLMTLAAVYWPRRQDHLPPARLRLFEVEPGTRLLAKCHWQPDCRKHPALVLVHGLEGSSESPYMLGIANKAYATGFSVLRLNQRNCGGTEHLTPTFYNSCLSNDCRAVLEELIEKETLPEIFFAGYSMGGNLVLKMAGEFGANPVPELHGVCAVCPGLDLAATSEVSGKRRYWLYERSMLRGLKDKVRKKSQLFPERYRFEGLGRLRTLREWDETVTAPAAGFLRASDYYRQASAVRVVNQIRLPTLVLTAEDDPFIPIESFRDPGILTNPFITLMASKFGGHCGFVSRHGGDGRFWAELQVVEFCRQHSQMINSETGH